MAQVLSIEPITLELRLGPVLHRAPETEERPKVIHVWMLEPIFSP
jgi:hypothetical protein